MLFSVLLFCCHHCWCSPTGNYRRKKLGACQWRIWHWIGLYYTWRCYFRCKYKIVNHTLAIPIKFTFLYYSFDVCVCVLFLFSVFLSSFRLPIPSHSTANLCVCEKSIFCIHAANNYFFLSTSREVVVPIEAAMITTATWAHSNYSPHRFFLLVPNFMFFFRIRLMSLPCWLCNRGYR